MLKLNNTLYMFIDCVNHSQSQSQMCQDLTHLDLYNTPETSRKMLGANTEWLCMAMSSLDTFVCSKIVCYGTSAIWQRYRLSCTQSGSSFSTYVGLSWMLVLLTQPIMLSIVWLYYCHYTSKTQCTK